MGLFTQRNIILLAIVYMFVCFLNPGRAWAQVTADFTINTTQRCVPAVVSFTSTSTGNITSYNWDFGNGVYSQIANPSTTYLTPGVKTITLTVSDGMNTSTISKTVTIETAPVVDFSTPDPSQCLVGNSFNFTSVVTQNLSGVSTYLWDFGDGTGSSLANPTHSYSNIGTYSVTLFIRNGAGCSATITKTNYISVVPSPMPAFTSANNIACSVPALVNFQATGTGGVSYAWDFGNNTVGSGQATAATYTSTGTYDVKLVVTGSGSCKDSVIRNAFVTISNIHANFNIPSRICTNTGTIFTNTSTIIPAGSLTSNWYVNGAGPMNGTDLNHTFTAPGSYPVKLVVSNGVCSDSITQNIIVQSAPIVDFSGTPTQFCYLPAQVSFTNLSANASNYLWHFGDGTNSTDISPVKTYTTEGGFHVTLVATGANGCVAETTKYNYITISLPQTQIIALPQNGCNPLTVEFSANSTLPVQSYNWNFGDPLSPNNTSTLATPTHTYNDSGTYTVTLYTSSVGGCLDTTTTIIHVDKKPRAGFIASPLQVCINDTVRFINQSTDTTALTTYTWSFGDDGGSTLKNPAYVYTDTGIFTVSLIVANGNCRDTMIRQSYVQVTGPKARFTYHYTCSDRLEFSFLNESYNNVPGPINYEWDFGDPLSGANNTSTLSSPTHRFSSESTFQVRLIAIGSNGCRDTIIQTVIINPINSGFSASSTNVCLGETIEFSLSSSQNSSYTKYWYWGDNTAASGLANSIYKSYNTPGIYSVMLVVVDHNGCSDTTIRNGYINVSAPVVNFSATPVAGCAPLSVLFTDNSSSIATITAREWHFGDGNILSGNNTSPAHLYNTGSYTVKLVITDNNGCKDSLSRVNYIIATDPTAAFTANQTNICTNQSVNFINTSQGNGLSYEWDFGDNSTSTDANPAHTYTTAGTYTVRLIVRDAQGCNDTLVRTAYITVVNLHAYFTIQDTVGSCAPYTQVANNLSAGATSYEWDLGNGTTSTSFNPTIVYVNPGTYVVRLIAVNNTGCRDTFQRTIVVHGPSGTFQYNPVTGCNPLTVTFTANAQNTSTYSWDMGNGDLIVTAMPTVTYTYQQSGLYQPVLVLSDGGNCSVGLTGNVPISIDSIHTFFTAATTHVCMGNALQFTDRSTAVRGTIVSWDWDFGDGGTSTIQHPSHIYTTPGTKNVRLTVTTANGCTYSFTLSINVVTASGLTVSPDQSYCYSAAGVQLSASGANSYVWSPGSSLSCTNCQNPIANPTVTTTYKVIGTNIYGCLDSAYTTVTIAPEVEVQLTASDTLICIGDTVTLTATGLSASGSYSWQPSGTLSATSGSTVRAFPVTTTIYTVIGNDGGACSDTVSITIYIDTSPSVSIAPSQPVICEGDTIRLTASGAVSYVWSPNTNISSTTGTSVVVNPASDTWYYVEGTGSNSCINRDSVLVSVVSKPVVSIAPVDTICLGLSVTLTASGATSYQWSPSTGLSGTTGSTVTASPDRTTLYTVIGFAGSCSDTAEVEVAVHLTDTTRISGARDICPGESVPLTALNTDPNASFEWSPATGLSSTTGSAVTASPAVSTTYRVVATNSKGCRDTSSVTINVLPIPAVSIMPSQPVICEGDTIRLTASGAVSYVWSPNTNISSTTGANVVVNPAVSTWYYVEGTGSNSCTNRDSVLVSVVIKPVVSIAPIDTICLGSSATLVASGAGSYQWSPSTGLSGTTGSTVTASPDRTTLYRVVGFAGSCSDTVEVEVAVHLTDTTRISGARDICPGESVPLTALNTDPNAGFEWSPSAGLSSTTGSAVTASPAVSTTYRVVATNSKGCRDMSSVTINVLPIPSVSIMPSQPVICEGDTIRLTASGAVSYVWSPNTNISSTTGTSVVVNPASDTWYYVEGTGSNSCINRDSVLVSVVSKPVVSIAPVDTICLGSSATLVASGAGSYQWSPSTGLSGTTGSTVTASPGRTTLYTVIGFAGSCSDTAEIEVAVHLTDTTRISGARDICPGEPVPLTALNTDPNASFEWSPATGLSSTTGSAVTASPTVSTTYRVVATNSKGCRDTSSVTINVLPIPSVSIAPSQPVICEGDTIRLTASGAVSYVWSPNTNISSTTGTSVVVNPASDTWYYVEGAGSNSCINRDSVLVSVVSKPVVSIVPVDTICLGLSVTLTASGATSYQWSPSTGLSGTTGSTVTASPGRTTLYRVVGFAGSCSDTAEVEVAVHLTDTTRISGARDICPGEYVPLTALNTDPNAGFEWSPATGLSSTTGSAVTASPTVSTTYRVVATNSKGCRDTSLVTINVLPLPSISITPSQPGVCRGNSINLEVSGGGPNAVYIWSPGVYLNTTGGTSVIATPDTSITYTVTATSQQGCRDSVTTTIQVYALPTVIASGDTSICAGSSTGLTASGAVSYSWQPGTSLSNSNIPNPTATPASSTAYIVTGTDANNCSNTDTVTVSVNPLPVLQVNPGYKICTGDTIQLSVSGADTYSWSPATYISDPGIATPYVYPSVTTVYTVVGTDNHGCSNTANTVINVMGNPPSSISSSQDICAGESVQLSASGGGTYEWSPAGSLSNPGIANPSASPDITTIYSVIIKKNECFTDTLTTIIRVHPVPVVTFPVNPLRLSAGSVISLEPVIENGSIYEWTPSTGLSCNSCPNPKLSSTTNNTYTIKVSNEWGCTASASVDILTSCDESMIFMPNTFTPNNDGMNDIFYPRSTAEALIVKRFIIYNRWGEVMYQAQDFKLNDELKGWDGTYKSKQLSPDTYIYILEINCTDGSLIQLKGDINLIR